MSSMPSGESASGGSRTLLFTADVTRQPVGAVKVAPPVVASGVSADSSASAADAGDARIAAAAMPMERARHITSTKCMTILAYYASNPAISQTLGHPSPRLSLLLNLVGRQFGRDVEGLRRFRRDITFDPGTLPFRLRDWIYRARKLHYDYKVIIYRASYNGVRAAPGCFSDERGAF